MAFDAVQMLRQTYAHGADAARMMELAAGKGAADAVQPETGKVNGMSFAVEVDPMAELMDSMEELSLQFEEKAQKKVSQRRMGEMQGPRFNYLKAVEAWQSMFPDMPGPEFLSRLLRNARSAMEQGRRVDVDEFLKELARGSTDPSHQYAMLDILMKGCGESEKQLQALLRDAQAQLERTRGPEIRAGVNIAQEINARASSGEQMQSMRDMYRAEVMGFTSPQACFRALLASGGAAGLRSSIEFLIRHGERAPVDGRGGAWPHPHGSAVRRRSADRARRPDDAGRAHDVPVRRDVPARRGAAGRPRHGHDGAGVRSSFRHSRAHLRLRNREAAGADGLFARAHKALPPAVAKAVRARVRAAAARGLGAGASRRAGHARG